MQIAVLRCNAIGDYLMATPALAALRARFPEARLTLLGARWHAQFLRHRAGPVDEVLVLPQVPGLAGQPADGPPAAELEPFLTGLRHRQLNLAVQLHGGGRRSNPLMTELGAGLTIGLRAPDAAPLDRWLPYRYYQPEVVRLLEVVGLVGASGAVEYPRLALRPAERRAAARLLPDPDAPWVALGPGASDPRRRWPVPRFASLASELTRSGVRVLLIGSAADRASATEISATAPGLLNLTGRTDLGTLAAVLARCALLVANDSGPLHLARAVGIPTVGLYWCGNAINAAPPTRRTHRPVLSWTVHCPVCGADCTPVGNPHRPGAGCGHRPSFLSQIPVAEVVSEVTELLNGR